MKKLLMTLFLSLGFVSSVYAADLISVATGGKANENSAGVKALNDKEMSEVVGGATLVRTPVKDYGFVNNSGQNIYYTAYYKVNLEAGDAPYFNLGSNYYAAVATTYDFRTNKITDEVVKINYNNSADIQTIDFQANVKGKIKDYYQAINWIKQDKANIKFFK